MLHDVGSWWFQAFGEFGMGDEGYPDAGQVVKYYRELQGMRTTYLGHQLGMSDVAVRAIESKKSRLDSLMLRRKLVNILRIPPFLLGLDARHQGIGGMRLWWVEEGYPLFGIGEDGYPVAGQVVKYYRDVMKQRNGAWTQIGLGAALDVSDVAVRCMENNNEAMDSVSRRRALIFILGIPPALLGLDELYYTSDVESLLEVRKSSEVVYLDRKRIMKYSKMLEFYWKGYYSSTLQVSLKEIVEDIRDLRATLLDERGVQRMRGLELLCRYYQFAATVARDQCNYRCAYLYARQAIRFARDLGDPDLIASAYLRRGFIYFEEGKIAESISDLDIAYAASKTARTALRGLITQVGGHFHTHMLADEQDRRQALNMLDEAERLARDGPYAEDDTNVLFNEGWYHAERAEALIEMHRYDDALEALDLAEGDIPIGLPRRRAHLDIFRSRVFVEKGQLEEAACSALDAVELCRASGSSIQIFRVLGIYQSLKNSSYGSDPSVAKLGVLLRGV